jgi:sec-independent protein translocase protein TatC
VAEELLKDSVDEEGIEPEKEMTFLEHLEELRWRIIFSIIGIVVGTIIAWIFIDFLVDAVLLKPAKDSGAHLQNLRPFGQLFLYMQIAIMVGIIVSIPNIFYQFWQFISPALRKHERRYIFWIVTFSSVCFLMGIAFAYFVMLPLTLKFAAQFGSQSIKNAFSIEEYMSIIISDGFIFFIKTWNS